MSYDCSRAKADGVLAHFEGMAHDLFIRCIIVHLYSFSFGTKRQQGVYPIAWDHGFSVLKMVEEVEKAPV
jgi:hypothetical protein